MPLGFTNYKTHLILIGKEMLERVKVRGETKAEDRGGKDEKAFQVKSFLSP